MTTKTQTAAERAAEAIERDAYVSNTYTSSSEFDRELAVSIITREYAELERAAERLVKEVGGLMAISEHELRVAAGNTNVSCLIGKLQEVNDALQRVRGQE